MDFPSALSRLRAKPSTGFRLAVASASLAMLSAPSLSTTLPRESVVQEMLARDTAQLSSQLVNFTVQGEALVTADTGDAIQRNAAIPLAAPLADRVRPFRSIAAGTGAYSTALDCMTEAIYYEAANESTSGQRAVAQVILNRVAHPAYPSSVCGVIYQGYTAPVCQFSYTCDGSLARRPVAALWQRARDVARAALAGHVEERVGTATHYHADYVLPYWAYTLDKVAVEGRHIFYRLPGGAGRAANFSARWSGREVHPAFDPSRFALAGADALDEQEAAPAPAPHLRRDPTDPTDRRSDNDVGGRLDPTSGWTLAIPDPTSASSGYRAALENQASAEGSNTPLQARAGVRP